MIILDTDCLSLLNREKILESSTLRRRLDSFPPDEIFTTIISFEEQMRGWLAVIAKAKTPEQQIFGYERLHISLEAYRNTTVLDYDENAAKIHQDLKSQKNPNPYNGFENCLNRTFSQSNSSFTQPERF